MAMIVDALIPADFKLTSLLPQTMPRPTELGVARVAHAQEAFVNGRPAIAGSRTFSGDLRRVTPEIHEAHAELHGSMSRETLSGNFIEEVGDAAIFFVSAAGALGMHPHEIETAFEERSATSQQLRLPWRRERRREFLREQLNALEITAAEITELFEQGVEGNDHEAAVKERLMDGLYHAIAIGEAVHQDMFKVMLGKIDRNGQRFTPEAFRRRGNEPDKVRYAIAYTTQKVREGKLSPEDAYTKLQADPDILAYGGKIDPHTLDLI